MGMPTAFTSSADFSGINGMPGLFISLVIHKAYVSVNESGTEAAAVTIIIGNGAGQGQHNIPIFNADHPFIFIIQEKQTGNILFMGKLSDPTK
jgi:serpin B